MSNAYGKCFPRMWSVVLLSDPLSLSLYLYVSLSLSIHLSSIPLSYYTLFHLRRPVSLRPSTHSTPTPFTFNCFVISLSGFIAFVILPSFLCYSLIP